MSKSSIKTKQTFSNEYDSLQKSLQDLVDADTYKKVFIAYTECKRCLERVRDAKIDAMNDYEY